MPASIKNIDKDIIAKRNFKQKPNFINIIENITADKISTIGYIISICLWQYEHLPFNKRKEITGIFFFFLSFVLQFGHFDSGEIILSPDNVLIITTL